MATCIALVAVSRELSSCCLLVHLDINKLHSTLPLSLTDDGRRNHQTLLIYSLREQRWITPSITGIGMNGLGGGNDGAHCFTVHGTPPPGRNGHTATLATCRSSRRNRINRQRARNHLEVNPNDIDFNHNNGNNSGQGGESGHPSEAEEVVDQALAELAEAIDAMDAELENHSSKNVNDNSQGGDDDNSQPNSYEHNPNEDMDDDDANNNNQQQIEETEDMDDDEDAQIIIIGGWLGSGPLAASDMWVLDISGGLERLRWFQPVSIMHILYISMCTSCALQHIFKSSH